MVLFRHRAAVLCLCPWKLICRKRRILIVAAILVLVVVLTLAFVLYNCCCYCSYDDIEQVINIICHRYEQNEVFGNLCADLCDTKILRPAKCIPNHLGKDIVFQAMYHNANVIVKSAHLSREKFDKVYWTDNGVREYPSIDIFYDMLVNTVKQNINTRDIIPKNSSLIGLLWDENLSVFTHLPTFHSVMDNIWSLVQQPEYLLLKYHVDKQIFPKILGACGSIYAEEFVQPLPSIFLTFSPAWRESFKKRVSVVLKIIDYLDTLEEYIPDIQICDVKLGHFGMDSLGNMKILDVDMIFDIQTLIKNMQSTNCSGDAECSFIDCKGSCDTKMHSCLPVVMNTNFQRICSNIFYGRLAPSYLGLLGLPPKSIAKDLQLLLKKCTLEMDRQSSTEMQKRLKLFLTDFLKN